MGCTVRRAAAVVSLLATVAIGCGSPQASQSTSLLADTEPPATTAPRVTAPIETWGVPTSTVPDARQVTWLYPSGDLPGLRLVDAIRTQAADCQPVEAECGMFKPQATLRFVGTDESVFRWLTIFESIPADAMTRPADGATERIVAGRSVAVLEQDAELPLSATWIEPLSGIVVQLAAINVSTDDAMAVIAALQPVDPPFWPASPPTTEPTCDDRALHIAPTLIPDGWQRVVLHAEAQGTCDPPVLMMSLVEPGTATAPGTLVTMTVGGAGAPVGTPEALVLGGHEGELIRGNMADGTPTLSFSTDVDGAGIELHGNVDEDQLGEIVASIRHLDDGEWAQLVSSVATPP